MSVDVLQPGDRCGRYTIVREIGRGGMGVVYLASDAGGIHYAIKTLQFARQVSDEQLTRFKHEIQVLASIDHINVVRFHEAGKVMHRTGRPLLWLALEYLNGDNLRVTLRQRQAPLPPSDVARWCKHIADGVAAAHRLRVVHRDLKPENVAIVQGIAKVYDFGIAKFRHWGTITTAIRPHLGTLGYMAPEQFQGQAIGPYTDVFALGVMLHELATGEHPFCPAGAFITPGEVVARCLAMEPPRLDQSVAGFPSALADIAQRAIARHPGARYHTMQEMSAALESVLHHIVARERAGSFDGMSGDWKLLAVPSQSPASAYATTLAEQGAGPKSGTVRMPATDVRPAATAEPAARSRKVGPTAPMPLARQHQARRASTGAAAPVPGWHKPFLALAGMVCGSCIGLLTGVGLASLKEPPANAPGASDSARPATSAAPERPSASGKRAEPATTAAPTPSHPTTPQPTEPAQPRTPTGGPTPQPPTPRPQPTPPPGPQPPAKPPIDFGKPQF